MNRGWGWALIAGVLVVGVVLAAPRVREELHWRWIADSTDPGTLKRFLNRWPQSRHHDEAVKRYDEATWRTVVKSNEARLRWYLGGFPSGAHRTDAEARIEELVWERLSKERTAVAFDRYVQAYTSGRFVAAARAQRTAVLADDAVFEVARKRGDRAAYETFLANYPGHAREPEARAVLADIEGRDIVDLLAEKKVEARATGSDIRSVTLELRRLVSHPIRVVVPVGTFFVSRDGSSQDMVTVAGDDVTLTGDDWVSTSVQAACAALHLDIPTDEVGFTIRRAPSQRELQKLMPVLDRAGTDQDVRQAAVWILSDDASYEDLGTLVETSAYTPFGGGARVINAPEAVRAMRLLAEAGIPLADKAIWWDREELLDELRQGNETELVSWLRSQKR
jgi:hypothetical protein